MANKVRILHRLAGALGSPATVEPSGVLALNFAPTGAPELWASNGTAWKQVNASLAASVMEFKGTANPTAAAPATPDVGDVYLISTAGTFAGSWTGLAGQAGAVGDQIIYDGTNWNLVRKDADMSLYLPLAGTAGVTGAAMTAGSVVTMNPTASGNTVLNGALGANFGAMDKFIIDGGTF